MLAASAGRAQDTVSVRVSSEPAGAKFNVDGQMYSHATTFLWPRGSKHVVTVYASSLSEGRNPTGCFDGPVGPLQYEPGCATRYAFTGWTSDAPNNGGTQALTQTITADGSISFLRAQFNVEYRVSVAFFEGNGKGPTAGCQQKIQRPAGMPRTGESIGVVFVGERCFDFSGSAWVPPGTYTLNAMPMYGYAFESWSINGNPAPSVATLDVRGPLNLNPRFVQAKRVRFHTSPPEMKVRVDYTDIDTPHPKYPMEDYPIPGLYDFLPGSKHVIGAPSPQFDRETSRMWVFSRFSNGQGQDSVLTAGTDVSSIDTLTAEFVPGVPVTIATEPKGLRLVVDGRENRGTTYYWGQGTQHSISALPEQTDGDGRRWLFKGWRHGGDATQQLTIDERTVATGGSFFVALYESQPQIRIISSGARVEVGVDGEVCSTPCVLNRPAGSTLRLTVPASLPQGENSRLMFTGWDDGSPSERSYTVGGDAVLRAGYQLRHRLTASLSHERGAVLHVVPPSADGFYAAGEEVSLKAEAKPGYRFRRWEWDLKGTWPSGSLTLDAPRFVRVELDRVPHLPTASVVNAAGPTPVDGVAAGSLIAIQGESLTEKTENGSSFPMPQTLGGVALAVSDRILPLVSVSPERIVALLPSDLSTGRWTVRFRAPDGQELTSDFNVTPNAPGLFSLPDGDLSLAVARREDGSPVTQENPARPGDSVTLEGTGFGPLSFPVIDGFPAPASPANPVRDLVEAIVEIAAGEETRLAPEAARAMPGTSGRLALRFRVPDAEGLLGVRVRVNGADSNTVLLPVVR